MSIHWSLELIERNEYEEFDEVYDRHIADFNLNNSSNLRQWDLLGITWDRNDDSAYPNCGVKEITIDVAIAWLTEMDRLVQMHLATTTMYELVAKFLEEMNGDKFMCKVSWG